jgi:hypothetical protein
MDSFYEIDENILSNKEYRLKSMNNIMEELQVVINLCFFNIRFNIIFYFKINKDKYKDLETQLSNGVFKAVDSCFKMKKISDKQLKSFLLSGKNQKKMSVS